MSVKLYRHNEIGDVVAAWKNIHNCWIVFGTGIVHHENEKDFEHRCTVLPEAPEVGSDEWAIAMLKKGHKLTWGENRIWHVKLDEDNTIVNPAGKPIEFVVSSKNDWQLYEVPKPIVECLPHKFVEGQKVLQRGYIHEPWRKARIALKNVGQQRLEYAFLPDTYHTKSYWGKYCLPYAGNEHLEGQITEGEHGAIPKGYVPPHVPKLGEESYWVEGDNVLDLSSYTEYTVHSVNKHREELRLERNNTGDTFFYHVNGKFMGTSSLGLRLIYHKGSYVREDGTVHEHIPTRPHRIED